MVPPLQIPYGTTIPNFLKILPLSQHNMTFSLSITLGSTKHVDKWQHIIQIMALYIVYITQINCVCLQLTIRPTLYNSMIAENVRTFMMSILVCVWGLLPQSCMKCYTSDFSSSLLVYLHCKYVYCCVGTLGLYRLNTLHSRGARYPERSQDWYQMCSVKHVPLCHFSCGMLWTGATNFLTLASIPHVPLREDQVVLC